jgi:hypothetical protein
MGYAAGGLASPAAIKLGINVANATGKLAAPIGQYAANNAPAFIGAAQRIAQNQTTPTQNQSAPEPDIDQKTLGIFKQNPDLIDGISDPKIKSALSKQIGRSPAVGQTNISNPQNKGPDAWAQSGLQKLGIQDQGFANQILQDPKAKQLLIQASDLTPGSKAMIQIQNQIKTRYGRQK